MMNQTSEQTAISALDVGQLRAIAQAATPGKRQVLPSGEVRIDGKMRFRFEGEVPDLAYLEHFSPEVVLELLRCYAREWIVIGQITIRVDEIVAYSSTGDADRVVTRVWVRGVGKVDLEGDHVDLVRSAIYGQRRA